MNRYDRRVLFDNYRHEYMFIPTLGIIIKTFGPWRWRLAFAFMCWRFSIGFGRVWETEDRS